ncbi:polysaccharide pyruvyl transferase family protein [Nakamurella flavida]|uniref:Polysaccharide pyruvyl transferase family protein n=1 Tax=Nakamurella flavida TaxID=363630 RepID=A0A938YMD1_9ACTN|nr:polysaccharide pyruvyl transferase family protein [Nakamurella flavida]MBM9475703.1 polysaccharide pyruvyl transferase family protein [Nakamurella flavida]MDP9778019.1 pyruvyl transferase EpsO [Nakamurella flavida]
MSTDPLEVIQQRTLAALSKHLHPGEPVALLDFPSYQNAGDTLIYVGERAYLDRLGVPVRYLADHARYRPEVLRKHHPEGPILLRGGGNFGDRWQHMQELREQVVKDFPDRRIIQLPQSVEFRDAARLAQARAVFAAHPGFVILVRETPSFERAQTMFPDNQVEYCPDAAFGVGYLPEVAPATEDVVMVLREDSEGVERGVKDAVTGRAVDWGLHGPAQLAWMGLSVHKVLAQKFPTRTPALYPLTVAGYRAQVALNMGSARRIVSRGRVLVTDRLHAAVLGALMRRPTIALDNSYGKISSIYNDYMHTLDGIRFVESAEEVRQAVKSLAA